MILRLEHFWFLSPFLFDLLYSDDIVLQKEIAARFQHLSTSSPRILR